MPVNKKAAGLQQYVPYVASGAAGAGLGSGLGWGLSHIFWKNPTRAQKLIMMLAGALTGSLGGVTLASSLGSPEKLSGTQSAIKNIKGAVVGLVPSLLGQKPTKAEARQMSTGQKAIRGLPGGGLTGWFVRRFKEGTPNIAQQNFAQTALDLGAMGTGAWAGTKFFDKLNIPIQRKERILQLLKAQEGATGANSKAAQVAAILRKRKKGISATSAQRFVNVLGGQQRIQYNNQGWSVGGNARGFATTDKLLEKLRVNNKWRNKLNPFKGSAKPIGLKYGKGKGLLRLLTGIGGAWAGGWLASAPTNIAQNINSDLLYADQD